MEAKMITAKNQHNLCNPLHKLPLCGYSNEKGVSEKQIHHLTALFWQSKHHTCLHKMALAFSADKSDCVIFTGGIIVAR